MNTRLAGLDIGAKTLTLAIRKNGKTHKPRDFGNEPATHAALIQALRHAKVTRVSVEATGVYHLDVAVALHKAQG